MYLMFLLYDAFAYHKYVYFAIPYSRFEIVIDNTTLNSLHICFEWNDKMHEDVKRLFSFDHANVMNNLYIVMNLIVKPYLLNLSKDFVDENYLPLLFMFKYDKEYSMWCDDFENSITNDQLFDYKHIVY